ncbi:MAG: hypothetical protein Q4G13_09770 [Moraxella sp.]|nr:hypothetical protein [Moraxella sp.]
MCDLCSINHNDLDDLDSWDDSDDEYSTSTCCHSMLLSTQTTPATFVKPSKEHSFAPVMSSQGSSF